MEFNVPTLTGEWSGIVKWCSFISAQFHMGRSSSL